jgi:hypothetical protein
LERIVMELLLDEEGAVKAIGFMKAGFGNDL